jgi:hypothetical protein|tara:strand:- start:225 stop:407 length:183 start_codon:yes stop_codon:yes gene_type:complete
MTEEVLPLHRYLMTQKKNSYPSKKVKLPAQGIIDKVFVYDRAIRQQECKDLMDGFKAIES